MSEPAADPQAGVNEMITAQIVMSAFAVAASDPHDGWTDAAEEFDRVMKFYLAERPDLYPRMMLCVLFVLGVTVDVLVSDGRDDEPEPDKARRALLLAVDAAHPISEQARRALDTAVLATPDLRPTPTTTTAAVWGAASHGPLFEGTTALLRRIVDQHDADPVPASWLHTVGQVLGMAMHALNSDDLDADGDPTGPAVRR